MDTEEGFLYYVKSNKIKKLIYSNGEPVKIEDLEGAINERNLILLALLKAIEKCPEKIIDEDILIIAWDLIRDFDENDKDN